MEDCIPQLVEEIPQLTKEQAMGVYKALGIVKRIYVSQNMDDQKTLICLAVAMDLSIDDPVLGDLLKWVKKYFEFIEVA